MGNGGRKAQPDGGSAGPYRVEISASAAKRLKLLPHDLRTRIVAKLWTLATGPKPVKGRPGVFRLRIGDWRATYEVHHAQRLVAVLEIEPGHDVY